MNGFRLNEVSVINGRCDLNTNLTQVYPEQVTITVYKPNR